MNLLPRRYLLAALAVSSLLSACGRDDPPAPPPTVEVAVVTLAAEPVALTRELPGRTNPFLVAEVRPQVSGIVKQRLFTEGSVVKAGQPLYQIDAATYQADANSAQAALSRAQAALKSAQLTAARIGELAKIDAVSAQDNENSIATLRQAEADVGVARAALDGTNVVLGHARIDAPITGRIGKSAVTQGALVTANQATPLAIVQQLDPIYIDVTQSSSELLQLRKELAAGTITETSDVPVSVLLEDGSVYAHDGKLAFSDVSVNPETGSYLLRVIVPNPEGLLLPGMYVRAVISNGERADGLLVPQEGVTRDAKGNAVAMVVGADEKIEQRTLVVNRSLGNRWLVDSGLVAGDRVVVEGLQKIQPGAQVVATERGATTAATGAAEAPETDDVPAPTAAN
jgi:membrane fusion protein, multidrug efflux system